MATFRVDFSQPASSAFAEQPAVRDRWNGVFARQAQVTLKGPVDKLGLFHPLFARAEEIEAQPRRVNDDDERVIREAFKAMGVD